ncbi:amidohydrolase family protein [Lichenicoccus sp.]|uniref:amidohydrolase family protein n=1 Tax=Lichenicoccus sp. TaxID=2781899 RepID=UPI003D11621D
MSGATRIDVHQHLLPPEFIEALERHGMGAWAPAAWSEEGALAMMDQNEIATGVLSLSMPGTHFGDDAEARVLTRKINERLAGLVKRRPNRFGMFASVPLPDIDGSLEAIREAYDDFSTDGVVLMASIRGTYIGDPAFDPVMAELDRRAAIIYIHPTPLAGPPAPGVHPILADVLLDTTRAAINMVLQGVPRRFPNLKIILAHGGGFLPYAAYRVATLANVIDQKTSDADVLDGLSSFYFDTGLASSSTSLPSLLKFARPGHILFGTDWPYCLDKTVTFFTGSLDNFGDLDLSGHSAINRQNAEALFSRLAGLVS